MSITLNNFEEFVNSEVLERAKNYLDSGSVTEVEELYENDFTAVVLGTTRYNVNIRINNKSELLTHQCNCPYDFGPICKHKVALLLKISAHKKNGIAFQKGSLTRIKEKLERCKKEELLQLLLVLAKSNSSTQNQIMFQLGLK